MINNIIVIRIAKRVLLRSMHQYQHKKDFLWVWETSGREGEREAQSPFESMFNLIERLPVKVIATQV